ncbi:hypothetical protein YC2023_011652 [Brassica napus]
MQVVAGYGSTKSCWKSFVEEAAEEKHGGGPKIESPACLARVFSLFRSSTWTHMKITLSIAL